MGLFFLVLLPPQDVALVLVAGEDLQLYGNDEESEALDHQRPQIFRLFVLYRPWVSQHQRFWCDLPGGLYLKDILDDLGVR